MKVKVSHAYWWWKGAAGRDEFYLFHLPATVVIPLVVPVEGIRWPLERKKRKRVRNAGRQRQETQRNSYCKYTRFSVSCKKKAAKRLRLDVQSVFMKLAFTICDTSDPRGGNLCRFLRPRVRIRPETKPRLTVTQHWNYPSASSTSCQLKTLFHSPRDSHIHTRHSRAHTQLKIMTVVDCIVPVWLMHADCNYFLISFVHTNTVTSDLLWKWQSALKPLTMKSQYKWTISTWQANQSYSKSFNREVISRTLTPIKEWK